MNLWHLHPGILFGIISGGVRLSHIISSGLHGTIPPPLPLYFEKTRVRMRRVHVYHVINQIYFVWLISSLLIDQELWQGIALS